MSEDMDNTIRRATKELSRLRDALGEIETLIEAADKEFLEELIFQLGLCGNKMEEVKGMQ